MGREQQELGGCGHRERQPHRPIDDPTDRTPARRVPEGGRVIPGDVCRQRAALSGSRRRYSGGGVVHAQTNRPSTSMARSAPTLRAAESTLHLYLLALDPGYGDADVAINAHYRKWVRQLRPGLTFETAPVPSTEIDRHRLLRARLGACTATAIRPRVSVEVSRDELRYAARTGKPLGIRAMSSPVGRP